jgi:hypothetical protein
VGARGGVGPGIVGPDSWLGLRLGPRPGPALSRVGEVSRRLAPERREVALGIELGVVKLYEFEFEFEFEL